MPKYYFRSVATQTLIASRDYEVEAETVEAARELLEETQAEAQSIDSPVPRSDIHEVWHHASCGWRQKTHGVLPLDPHEISDGENWLVQLDPETGQDIPTGIAPDAWDWLKGREWTPQQIAAMKAAGEAGPPVFNRILTEEERAALLKMGPGKIIEVPAAADKGT